MDSAGFRSAAIHATWTACPGALVFAAQHPERVDALALWLPFAEGVKSKSFEQLVGWSSAEAVSAFYQDWLAAIDHWGRGESLQLYLPSLATARNIRWFAMTERASCSPAMIRTLFDASLGIDIRHVLALVQAPTLVLAVPGSRLPETVVAQVAELLPNSDYRMIPQGSDLREFVDHWFSEVKGFMFGAEHEVNPGRVLMTVMFTDIVRSTELAASLGDMRWREVLAALERLLRREVEAAGGRVVKLIGDGSLCTFPGPARAIRCAERLCLGVHDLGIEIRVGLHAGECELIDDDVAGMAVHLAARVSACAGPGEVVVSRTMRDLVTGSGIQFQTRGEYELKGVPGAWELYSVGPQTGPIPAPDQRRQLRFIDRAAMLGARHAPALMRVLSRPALRSGHLD
jgi:class 3 adenylate cyclase